MLDQAPRVSHDVKTGQMIIYPAPVMISIVDRNIPAKPLTTLPVVSISLLMERVMGPLGREPKKSIWKLCCGCGCGCGWLKSEMNKENERCVDAPQCQRVTFKLFKTHWSIGGRWLTSRVWLISQCSNCCSQRSSRCCWGLSCWSCRWRSYPRWWNSCPFRWNLIRVSSNVSVIWTSSYRLLGRWVTINAKSWVKLIVVGSWRNETRSRLSNGLKRVQCFTFWIRVLRDWRARLDSVLLIKPLFKDSRVPTAWIISLGQSCVLWRVLIIESRDNVKSFRLLNFRATCAAGLQSVRQNTLRTTKEPRMR